MDYFDIPENHDRLLREVDSWLGTPYRHMQCTKGRGADCTLFIGSVLKEVGALKDFVYTYYPKDWQTHTSTELIIDHFRKHASYLHPNLDFIELNDPDDLKFGDVLGFSICLRKLTNHSAIYLGDRKFIHSINGKGVVYSTLDAPFKVSIPWIKTYTTTFRVGIK